MRAARQQLHRRALREALAAAFAEEDAAHAALSEESPERPGADGRSGGQGRQRSPGAFDERLDPGAVAAVEKRVAAGARGEQPGELAPQVSVVTAMVAQEILARRALGAVSRRIEKLPESLPAIRGVPSQRSLLASALRCAQLHELLLAELLGLLG